MDYKNATRAELLDEIKRRRSAGSKISVEKGADDASLKAALLADDKARVEALDCQIPLEPETPTRATQPDDDVFANGFKARHKVDKFVYQVALVDEETDARPYKARVPKQSSGHPGLYWEGSTEEFTATFDRV